MRDYRRSVFGVAAGAAAALAIAMVLTTSPMSAQAGRGGAAQPAAGRAGLPAGIQTGPFPRTAWDKKPDMNGIWQAMTTANDDLEDHDGGPSSVMVTGAVGAHPAGLSVVEGGTIPYKPEAIAKRN